MDNYQQVITKELAEGITIEYGWMEGNNTILFIKVGQNGNIYGFENKYLRIAADMNRLFGYTVVVSSNPFNGQNPLDQAFDIIEDYCKAKGFSSYDVYYMGHSNGALIGFTWGYLYPQIKKMLLINGPLMLNWHRSKAGLTQSVGQDITFVYGEKDPSFFFVKHIDKLAKENPSLQVTSIKDADHHFQGMMDVFLALPILYLGDKETPPL